jgi:hypothetical protein
MRPSKRNLLGRIRRNLVNNSRKIRQEIEKNLELRPNHRVHVSLGAMGCEKIGLSLREGDSHATEPRRETSAPNGER